MTGEAGDAVVDTKISLSVPLPELNEFFCKLPVDKKTSVCRVRVPTLFKDIRGEHYCSDCGNSMCFYNTEAPVYHDYIEFLGERANLLGDFQLEELYQQEESTNKSKSKCCTDFLFDALYVKDNHLLPSPSEMAKSSFVLTIYENLQKSREIQVKVKDCLECRCGLTIQVKSAIIVLQQIEAAYHAQLAEEKSNQHLFQLLQETSKKSKRKKSKKNSSRTKLTPQTKQTLPNATQASSSNSLIDNKKNSDSTQEALSDEDLDPQALSSVRVTLDNLTNNPIEHLNALQTSEIDPECKECAEWVEVSTLKSKGTSKKAKRRQRKAAASASAVALNTKSSPAISVPAHPKSCPHKESHVSSSCSNPITNFVRSNSSGTAAVSYVDAVCKREGSPTANASVEDKPEFNVDFDSLERQLNDCMIKCVQNPAQQQTFLHMISRVQHTAVSIFNSSNFPSNNSQSSVTSSPYSEEYSPIEATRERQSTRCLVPGCFSDCNGEYYMQIGSQYQNTCGKHDGELLCGQTCEASACEDQCAIPWSYTHTLHACATSEEDCSYYCITPGCEEVCDRRDHFHAVSQGHFCKSHSSSFSLPDLFARKHL
jgi:hypothetical protein